MEKKLKVLAVNTDLTGGAGRAAYRIHNAVMTQGVDSYMFVKQKKKDIEKIYSLDYFTPKNIFYQLYNFVQNKIKNKVQHARWAKYPNKEDVFLSDLRSVSFHGALQKINSDILHLHWINLRFLSLKDLVKHQKPIVWTLHDSWAFTGICHYFYDCESYKDSCGKCPFLQSTNKCDLSYKVWRKKKRYYKNLNLHIVTPSKWLADAAHESSLLKNFPITVIPNPIDTEVFKPSDKTVERKHLKLDPNKTYILYGAINAVKDRNKGFAELLSAVDFLEKKISADKVELLVFGANKPIEQLNVNIPVRYLGIITNNDDLVSMYNAADVMVVPSLSEVFGQTASEAMACGTPVVAFNCTGIKEVVDHKKTGYLAEPYSSEDLADGIIWCLENNHNGKLSRNAINKVMENYSNEKVGKIYANLYFSLL